MAFSEDPIPITTHMFVQDVAMLWIHHILEDDHSILMQTLKGHLQTWGGIRPILEVCLLQWYPSRIIWFRFFQDCGWHDCFRYWFLQRQPF
jgi:hypothetical protein